ncbi:MAG TPA: RagB/SusD family nutrient uptake outer membrane protein [Gemmatimonadaceae bacterium]|nr:RagB/SusD family nutrient uptake outer membrane protein [Gemmatimonadaceae bacterium]
MKRLYTTLLAGSLLLVPAGCSDYLDVNENPNAPETVAANLYLPPMLHWMVTSPQFDGRFVGRYTQQWNLVSTTSTPNTWDRMGYDPSSDNGAQQWRDVYWSLGQNLVDMTNLSRDQERWDLLGVAQILKAWGWLVLTDLHGEIIVKEAIDPNRFAFDYDTQEYAYQEVLSLLDSAAANLQRTDGAVSQAFMAKSDKIYGGDRTKWLKFAYGLKAIALNHFSNKASYKPADVVALVDKSFASSTDDALLSYPGTNNDDTNFWGRTRNNLNNYRQTQFAVSLMDGTALGSSVDPRLTRMLSPSPDGVVRGVNINVANGGAFTTAETPNNLQGYPAAGGAGLPGRYLFDDKAKIPNMTYAELQFVKAEAAFRMGDKVTALAAYKNGISAHIDWVNARNLDNGQTPTQITAEEKAAFLADPAIVPTSASALTITQIMVQKYIALWGWGHNEIWMDMRRFHYKDIDPATGNQVYPGFEYPTNLYPDNGGKPVWRIRPRFNSEYVWNREGLDVIGGLALDYHTKPIWIINP